MISAGGGGGKGQSGGGPIYNPHGTPGIENLLNMSTLGGLAQSNPALVNQFLSTGSGQQFANQSGLGTPGLQTNMTPAYGAPPLSGMPSGPSWGSNHYGQAPSGYNQPTQGQQSNGQPVNASSIAQFGPQVKAPDYAALQSKISAQPTDAFQFGGAPTGPFQYSGSYNNQQSNIMPVSDQAYASSLQRQQEGTQQDLKKFGAQAQNSFQARGLGNSGLTQGALSNLSRGAQEQMANFRSASNLQQAQGNIGLQQWQNQFNQGQNQFAYNAGQQQQGAQAGENANAFARMMGLQGAQASENQNAFTRALQQTGALGSLENQSYQQGMAPYHTLQQLYGQNIGIPVTPSQGSKGDPFSALLQAGGQIGGAALMA